MGAKISLQTWKEVSKGEEQDLRDFKVREVEILQKIEEIEEDLSREQYNLQNKLIGMHFNMCLIDGKKNLKEINELAKQERAKHSLMCEKSCVQKKQEITMEKLLYQRDFEHLLLKNLEAKQAEQQSNGVESETSAEVEQEADKNVQSVPNELIVVRENIRILEGQEMVFSKQLDAINTMSNRMDDDAAITTSIYDSRSTEMPTEVLVDESGKAIMTRSWEIDADLIKFEEKQKSDTEQRRAYQAALKLDLEFNLRELKTKVYKSRKTLKEMGEIMKKETANLERLSRKKELDNNLLRGKVVSLNLMQKEKLYLRRIGIIEEEEGFYREKYGGGDEDDERELQKLLLLQRERKEASQIFYQMVGEDIRSLKEKEILMNQELDAINKQIERHDEGIAIAITSTARLNTNVNPNQY